MRSTYVPESDEQVMPGGARRGAGRKPGNLTIALRQLTYESRRKIKNYMNWLEKRIADENNDADRKELARVAAQAATLRLPHVLPKLQALAVANVDKPNVIAQELSDAELEQIIRAGRDTKKNKEANDAVARRVAGHYQPFVG